MKFSSNVKKNLSIKIIIIIKFSFMKEANLRHKIMISSKNKLKQTEILYYYHYLDY